MDEQSLAIDIQLKKLLDWLISRRICNRQWHDDVLRIREKISLAIRDMPEHPQIIALLSGASINYFHCLQIVEILRETEKDTRNIFGSYGSQRMKDWQEVVRLYERDQVYLAEAAQLLSQSCSYEIPGLKKQLAKTLQVQEECDKCEKNCTRKAREFRAEFDKSCRQLGIKGDRVKKEIVQLMATLPDTYAEIAERSKKLKDAIKAYLSFLKSTVEDEGEVIVEEKNILPTLGFLVERGNVTTYELMHGEAPLCIEEDKIDYGEEEPDVRIGDDGNEDVIDFGDGEDTIDFGDEQAAEEIDWGNLNEESVEIDWDASAMNEGDIDVSQIVIEDGGVSGGVARNSEALTLLDNRRTRMLILDELTELQCFLRQRVAEIDGGSALAALGDYRREDDAAALRAWAEQIDKLISTLNTGKLHHLQLIRSSPLYVDRLVESLRQKLTLEAKMYSAVTAAHERMDSAIESQGQLQSKLKVVKGKTEELQKEVEKDISKRYKKRPVNIMGGVQAL